VNKFWGIFFAVVLGACGLSIAAAPVMGWGLPDGMATHTNAVDFLFYVIFWITIFFFILTEALFVLFILLYAGEPGVKVQRATGVPEAMKPLGGLVSDPHRVEMLWTLVPAIILLYIAFAQIGTWADVKYQKNMPDFGKIDPNTKKPLVPLPLAVSARQFEWRVRYPSHERFQRWLKAAKLFKKGDEEFDKADIEDLVNELHTWVGEPTVVYLTTRDVIHSFNIPMMRIKQDALPGKVIPVWFVPTQANTARVGDAFVIGKRFKDGTPDKETGVFEYKPNTAGEFAFEDDPTYVWDLPCAELCGWGHYRMIGRVYVHPSREQFLAWLEKADAAAHLKSGTR
jgi:cytochrome c oxidase subunit 2